MATRKLTVSRLYQPRAPRYAGGPTIERKVPFLRLSGKWLETAGFEIGSKVRVSVEGDRLVVERADGF